MERDWELVRASCKYRKMAERVKRARPNEGHYKQIEDSFPLEYERKSVKKARGADKNMYEVEVSYILLLFESNTLDEGHLCSHH